MAPNIYWERNMSASRRTILKGAAAAASSLVGLSPRIGWAQEGPIKIGVMYALSGVGAPVGDALLKGTQIAAAQINRTGGLLGRQVELVVRDDKYNGAAAVAAARELNGEGINLMIGGSQTVMALALMPIVPELKSVLIIPAAAGMPITHELFNRNTFRTTSNNYTQYRAMGRALVERHPGITTWAMLAPEGDFGRDSAKYFASAVTEYSAKAGKPAKVLDPIFAQATATDFKTQINALMNSPAEALFMGIVGAAQISFFQQARSVGLYQKFKVIGDAGNEVVTAKALQKNLPNNFWSVSYWNHGVEPFVSNPLSKQLYDDYVAMTGDKNPPGLVMAGHRAALGLFNGVKKAGSVDSEAVINALEGITFDTAGGPYTIRKEDHQGLGFNYYAHLSGSDTEPFYAVSEMIRVPEAEMAEPPSPGQKFS
jgi:branched-chain amino acid transport system substrate-binding protein